MDFGYTRVSTADQSTDRQLDSVKLDKTFTDKVSGSIKERPELTKLIAQVRTGDVIHVHSIDRIARNLQHLQEMITEINAIGVAVHFHKENMIFDGSNNPMQKMQMQMMGAVAEFERSMINERTREGREIAKAKGVKFGRKPKLTAKQIVQIKQDKSDGKPANAIAIDLDISRKSVYRALSQ